MSNRVKLGVNIDHVATVRQARRAAYPEIVEAALIAERAGADAITLHLRVDRRHIQDADVYAIKEAIKIPMNLEMANTAEMMEHALKVKPHDVCLVPETQEEITTEGGLDVIGHFDELVPCVAKLQEIGTEVSIFIDADKEQIAAAAKLKANSIELYTGSYSYATGAKSQAELQRLTEAAKLAHSLGLKVNGGHGLRLDNVAEVCRIPEIQYLHIGHSIIAHAVFVGLGEATKAMLKAIASA